MTAGRRSIIWILIAAIVGCNPAEKETKPMTELTQNMKSQCLGRYLVDVPGSFLKKRHAQVTLYYGRDEHFKTIDVEVIDWDATVESMTDAVDAKVADVSGEKNWVTKKSNLLKKIKESDHAFMLRFHEDISSDSGAEHELHTLVGKTYLRLKASSYEGISKNKEDLTEAVEARIRELASNIHTVDDPTAAGPGFCLGPVIIQSNQDFENGSFIFFDIAGHPDVSFKYSTSNQNADPKPLLERGKELNMYLGHGLSRLRAQGITIAGMPAQELVTKIKDDRVQYQFDLESIPDPSTMTNPVIHIDLDTGDQLADGRYIDSSMSEKDAISVWDAIIKSVRLRPHAVAK